MIALLRRCGPAALLLWLSLPAIGSAQIRASERGSLSQTIDGTVITLDYSRPQVRGRNPIFGGFVHWKEVWTPGANYATTLEVNRNVHLDGHLVRPGKYSMWLVVNPEEWVMVLDPRYHKYHTEIPDSTADQIRWVVHPGEGPFTEVLTFSFPEVRGNGGTLLLRWGTIELPFKVTVEPKHRLGLPAADAAPYLGAYLFRWAGTPDTVTPSKITAAYEKGMLIGHWDPAPWPEIATFVLVKIADDWFMVGTMEKGEMTDLMTEWVFEFSRSGAKATGFEVRGEGDRVDATAKREDQSR
jgi:hypothetical protein